MTLEEKLKALSSDREKKIFTDAYWLGFNSDEELRRNIRELEKQWKSESEMRREINE